MFQANTPKPTPPLAGELPPNTYIFPCENNLELKMAVTAMVKVTTSSVGFLCRNCDRRHNIYRCDRCPKWHYDRKAECRGK